MLRRTLALLILATVAMAGCARGAGTASSPSPSKTLTQAQLKTALLTSTDLPSGFTQSPDEGGEETDDEQICDAPDLEARAATTAEANFQQSEAGPFVLHGLAAFGAGAGKSEMDAFVAAVEKCNSWESDIEGENVSFRVAPLDLPALGEQNVTVRATARIAGVDIVVDVVVFRIADVIALLSAFSLGGDIDDLTPAIATRAHARLDALV